MPTSIIDSDGVTVGRSNPLPTQLGSEVQSVVIASGASLSAAIQKIGKSLIAIQTPPALDAAVLTFQGSMDGTTYCEIVDYTGTAVSAASVAASQCMSLDQLALALAPYPYIKVRTGTASVPQVQSAARTLLVGLA